MQWVQHIVFVSITCILTAVLANSHRHQETNTPFIQVPLMLSGTYATSKVLRSLNETTVFIAAFEQDFVLDVQKSRNFSILQSTVETIYRALDKPFRRKTTISDDCYFHGIIRGRRKSVVFLDACSKSICGILYDANYTYVITKATKENPILHRFKRLTSAERPRHERRQDPPEKFWRRWIRQTRQVTRPSGGHLENNFMELYIVHDHQQFLDSERDSEALRNKSITLAHLLGKVFQDVNITISLVGSEVWNEGDEITISSDVYTTLDNFLSWREQTLLPRQSHDFALLISGTTFLHHMKAHTYHGEMCSQTHSAAILEDYTDDIVQIASDIAHSIGDNIGLRHDTPDCSCEDDTGYCVMDVVKRKQPPTKFSTCSKGLLANHIRVGRLDCLNDLPTIPRGPLCGNGLLEEGEECDCGKPQECNDVCCLSSECLRRADCSRRSSQILAAAEVVTAPLDSPETEQKKTSSLTFSKNYPEDKAMDTSGPIIDEAVEERFNTIINADGAVAPHVPQPHTTEPTKTTSPQMDRTVMSDDREEVVVAEGGDLDNGVVATREALTEEVVGRNVTGDAVAEQQGSGLGAAKVETTSNLSTDNNSSTSDSFTPDEKSVDTAALCDVTFMSDGSQYVLGDLASVAEIMTELGESELPHPPAFIIEPEPELYIVRAIDLQLHCEASGNSVIGYTWLKDGEEIDIQSDPRMIIDYGNLTIQFPDSGDIGIYQCLVSNIYTTIVSSTSSVKRASMGRFSPGPGTIREVIVGTSIILACNPPLSVPTPLVMWALNHSAEPIHYSRRVSQDPKGNLVIATVEEQDTGLYHCIVVNEVMEKRIESPRINLIVRKPTHPPELVYYPEVDKSGLEGEQLSLKCLAVGNPVPQIWWEREDAELPHNRSSHTSFGQELIISSLKVEDAGLYRCIADNGAGERTEAPVTLTVKAAPSWESEPVSVTVPVGSPASFTCTARGDPTPAITWLINNQPAPEVSQALKLEIVEETGHGTLRVNQTMDVDSSSAVQCVASNRYGSIISNAHLTVLALAPVFQVNAPAEVVVLEGDTVRLPCRGLGAPSPTVTWWNNSGDKFVNGDRLQILADGSLVICDIYMTDERDYKCVLENKFGYQTSKAELFIRSRTRLINPPRDTQIMAGDQLILPCSVTSDPAHHITFTWMTPKGLEVSVGSGGDGSLRIESVTEEDEGMYTCSANSDLDSVSASASVVVQERPIPAQCGNSIVDDGEECDQGSYNASNPHPCCTKYCQWRSEIPCREDTHCCKDCQLVESGIPCQLDPEYPECYLQSYCNGLDPQCSDLNYISTGASCRNNGQCTEGVCIPFCELQGELETCDCPSEGDACIHCCVQDGICAPYLSQMDNSTIPLPEEDQLTCGQNGLCSQGKCISQDPTPRPITTPTLPTIPTTRKTATTTSKTVPSTRQSITAKTTTTQAIVGVTPDEVTDLRASPLSSTSIELSWRPPFDTHGDLMNYIVRVTDEMMGSTMEREVAPMDNSLILDNLDVYMLYEMTVIPYNANGAGGTSTIDVRTPGANPTGMPSNVSVNPAPAVPNALDVSWVPPPLRERNGEITQYKLRYRVRGGEAIAVNLLGKATSYRIEDLERETDYEVRIAMVNVNGTGPSTEWIPGRTEVIAPNENVPPSPPTLMEVRTFAHQITMHWKHPESAVILVEGYILGYGENIPDIMVLQLDGSTRYVELENLELNTNYVIKLRAFNKAGEGQPVYKNVRTSMDGSTRFERIMQTPVELVATPESSRAILLSWFDPNPANLDEGVIRYYSLVYSRNNGQIYYANATKPQFLVTGLRPASMYDFKVMVTEGQRVSDFSIITSAETMTAGDRLPNPPSEVTMTSLSSPLDVQLSWSVEGDDDHITRFDVEVQTAYSRGGWTLLASVPSNQTQARVNLAPYMTYRFRVTSVNAVGQSEPTETSGQYFTPPDRPISNPENVSFTVENGQVVVNWKANSPEEHGAPFFTYRVLWGSLGTHTWQEAIIQMNQHAFTIPASQEDGQYQVSVQAANAVGLGPEPDVFTYGSVKTTKASVTTTSPYLEFVLRPPEEMQVLVGSRLSLPCQAEGSPYPHTEWFFNSRRVVMSNQVEVDNNGQLVIDPADLSNTGVYLCRISNHLSGQVQAATSDVAVVAPMLVFTATPPAVVDVLIGESIVLPCQAGGFPQATLVWRFGKQEINYGVDIYMAENNSIIIPVADESHSGLYQCIISNGLHNVKIADSQVNVREQLQVSIEPVGILTIIGSEITLPCLVIHDHPLLRVYWTRNGVVIYENYINQTLQDYSLLIDSVTWDDWGNYRCVAETALDSRSDSVEVVIQTLPEAPYTIKINTTQYDPSEVGVMFDAPFDGNSPISSYIIEYSSPAAEVPWQVLKTIAPGNSSQVITKVTIPPYYGYYVRAKAVNEFGMSGGSEISDPIYMRPTEPTRNPFGVMTQVLDGGSKINVTWEPLSKSDLNGPGFYYIIDLRGANQRYGSMVTIDDFRQSNIVLDVDPSLMPYELMMQAGNNIGLGPMPEIVTAGIEEMGLAVPDAPTNVMIEMITPTSINVTWTRVPQRPTYGNVYGYRVIVQATTETLFGARPESCLSTTSNCEIAGLQRGTTYRVTVIANGDGGEGFSSMPVTVTVSADLPSVVRRLKVRTWARTMLIKWERPESGEVQGYVVIYQLSSGEGMAVEETLDSGIETSLKLGGLSPGSSYHVTVIAFNQAGRGEPTSMNINTKPNKSKRSRQ